MGATPVSRSYNLSSGRSLNALSLRNEYLSVRKKLAKYQSDLELFPWMVIGGVAVGAFSIYLVNQTYDIIMTLFFLFGTLYCFCYAAHVKSIYPFRITELQERLRGLETTMKEAHVKIPAICEICGKKLGWEGPWHLEPAFRCTQCGKAYCGECQLVLPPALPICPQCGGSQEMEGVFQPEEAVHLSERVTWVEAKKKGVLNLTNKRLFFLSDDGFPIRISFNDLKAISITGDFRKKLTLTYIQLGIHCVSTEVSRSELKTVSGGRRVSNKLNNSISTGTDEQPPSRRLSQVLLHFVILYQLFCTTVHLN